MRFQYIALAFLLVAGQGFYTPNCKAEEKNAAKPDLITGETPAEREQRMKWFLDSRFGLFIHWGPVSLKETEIGWSRGVDVPIEEYDQLHKKFNPTKFNADQWARIAKDAGMKYLVLTAKHHDGFCLWPSKYTDYDIASTPFKRDVVGELAAACKKHGIRFCVYYSVCDWYHPDYPLGSRGMNRKNKNQKRPLKPNHSMPRYNKYIKNQTKELIENYEPGVIWFDGEWEEPWTLDYGNQLYKHLLKHQPSVIVNNRVSKGRRGKKPAHFYAGDFNTPEQKIGGFDRERPWETCMTICQQWAWKSNDKMKSKEECIQTLLQTVGGDGNLLLNVGPMPDGRIEPRQVERLKEVGDWLKKYGDGIYGARGGPFKPGKWGASTCKGNKIYLFIMKWQTKDSILLPMIDKPLKGCRSLSGGKAELEWPKGIQINLPKKDHQKIATVIELTVDGDATNLTPIEVPDWTKPNMNAAKKAVETWRKRRVGMFIHWGPVSLTGKEISWSRSTHAPGRLRYPPKGGVSKEKYDNLYKRFNPEQFDGEKWVQIAKDAGMKYLVFTTKHHDGFSTFDSKQTNYDIMSTPYGKDICKKLADACHRNDLALGWYYSPRDWHHPDFATKNHDRYLDFYMAQLRELATNYGKVDILWFDCLDSAFHPWKDTPIKSFEMLRRLQPGIMLNERGGLRGDFDTAEQHVGGFDRDRPWETCMTIGRQWAWKPDDKLKSKKKCIQALIYTVGGDGNFLFNVGPMPDGRIEPRQVERLKEMGDWLKKYGNGIYGTCGGPFKPGEWGASTCKGNKIYLFIMKWPKEGPLQLPAIRQMITDSKILSNGDATVRQLDGKITIGVSAAQRDKIATVIELTLDGNAVELVPAAVSASAASPTDKKQK